MGTQVRFGMIGCGGISRMHREQIANIPGAVLVAVADRLEQSAKAVGEQVGVDWYTDYHEMLRRPDIDIVTIVTPSGTHAEMIVDAARAGKHVIVEKPIDTTVEKAEWAISECRRAGVKLSVISQHRFDDSTLCLKEEIAAGKFGDLFLGQATIHWYRSQAYYERSPGNGTWAADGGGVLMIQALHTIDVLQYLMGPVDSVNAYTKTVTHTGIEVEDVAVATLIFRNGALATISATTSAFPKNSTRIEIMGEFGTAVVENDQLKCLYFRKRDEPGEMFGGDSRNWADNASPEKKGCAHRRQFEDVLDAIQNSREPLVNGEEGLKILKLITAMYESSRTHQPVKL